MAAGRVFKKNQIPLKVRGQSYLKTLTVGFTIGVVSRKILVASEQLRSLPEGFQAPSSAFGNLQVELRGREVPGPRPMPPVRTPLEIEASLLDSDVQGLLGTDELDGEEPISGPQLQWGYSYRISECRDVVPAQLLRDSTDSGWEWRLLCNTCKGSSCRSGFWDAGSCASFRLSCGGIHRDCCRPRRPAGYFISIVPEGSIRFSPDGRLPHIPSLVRFAARDKRFGRIDGGCVLSSPRSAEEDHTGLKHKVRKSQRSVHHQAGSRPRLRSVNAKPNSRQRCSLTWKISLAGWPSSRSGEVEPCDVGDSCSFAKDKQPCVTRGSHSAWSRCRQSHSSPGQATSSRGPIKKRCACRSTCKVGHSSSGQAQKRTLT